MPALLVFPVLGGLALALVTGISIGTDSAVGVESAPVALTMAVVLAVGLYGSCWQIDRVALRQHRRTVLLAVTVGVLAKAALIGIPLAILWGDPLFVLLGLVMAQIDPLATAGLLAGARISPAAKSILAAWSAFDDPITVVAVVYVSLALSTGDGPGTGSIAGDGASSAWFALVELGRNLGFAAAVCLLWWVLRRWRWASILLLFGALGVAVWQFMMLGVALIGLVVRPPIGRWLAGAVRASLVVVGGILGVLLADGVDLLAGVALGLAAFAAQLAMAPLVARRLPRADRWYLACAQQNGVTAITLAVALQFADVGAVSIVGIVGPAIVTVNVVHAVAQQVLNRAGSLPMPSS